MRSEITPWMEAIAAILGVGDAARWTAGFDHAMDRDILGQPGPTDAALVRLGAYGIGWMDYVRCDGAGS